MEPGKPLTIYVAGPMTPRGSDVHDSSRIFWQRVVQGIEAGAECIRRGHNPYIPHLTYFVHVMFTPPFPKGYPYSWYSGDKHWLLSCDAILMIEGWENSFGAKRELEWAKERGMKVFYSVND